LPCIVIGGQTNAQPSTTDEHRRCRFSPPPGSLAAPARA
jgi:hypothetical protein